MEGVHTSLFDGVSASEYAAMMTCFKTTLKRYGKGEEVEMPRERVGVVQSGSICLLRCALRQRRWRIGALSL